jgi:hypothetical protein
VIDVQKTQSGGTEMIKEAYELGVKQALVDSGLIKEAVPRHLLKLQKFLALKRKAFASELRLQREAFGSDLRHEMKSRAAFNARRRQELSRTRGA